ncbi:MAG: DinB family protein [Anaerolineae bacterium]|uniref:DinB family protein n=1 Tax=Promineifilum sp. TaxID=2664178 RepID=UPI001D46C09A|nr:DinB family protein [Anaerolineales bacterium]MCB8935974.1 DinB family protein [Promineifilum sp.]MCO5182269.1 DinB family protein [Promineifilum sp.]MCW5848207.1 DinB family protein [Anaerolineae bacterium]
MLDFARLRNRQATLDDLMSGLTVDDLRDLTNEMIDHQLALIADCTDADVTFVPDDPAAEDKYAADASEANLAWTLGHVIVHVTASSEEKAFLAAEQARGIDREGRSRYETPWQTVTTIAQVRARLEESRRMRLATLDVWPDEPDLDLTINYRWLRGSMNAVARFAMGLFHDDDHLGQIAEIVRQAHAARQPA